MSPPAGSEIVVIDDGSTGCSADLIAQRRGRIKLHRVANYGVARARNHGAARARGSLIVYADAHLRLDPFWWRPIVELLQNPKVAGVASAIAGYRGQTARAGRRPHNPPLSFRHPAGRHRNRPRMRRNPTATPQHR